MKNTNALLVMIVLCATACANDLIECDDDTPPRIDQSTACIDFDPCTDDVYNDKYGCTHKLHPSGTQCFNNEGRIGVCSQGLCVVTKNDFVDTICTESTDGCYGIDPYIVRRIDGACVNEWCNYNTPGRSLQPKPAGSPCVKPKQDGSPEFATSQCNSCGECI
jgi:hypothetical protein